MPRKTAETKNPVAPATTDTKPPRQPRTPRAAKPEVEPKGAPATAAVEMRKALDVPFIQIETMAHALIFDIGSLRDVVAKLKTLPIGYVDAFFAYYVERFEVLLKDDAANGEIRSLMDLGAWRLVDSESDGDDGTGYYNKIISRLPPLSLTPVQIGKVLAESYLGEREGDVPTRGETWIPKTSRRASAK